MRKGRDGFRKMQILLNQIINSMNLLKKYAKGFE